MKYFSTFFYTFLAGMILSACGNPLLPARYRADLPSLPGAWTELLGEPRWRLEWIDPAGGRVFRDGAAADFGDLEIPLGPASPILAWPYWPRSDIPPGCLRPAGALFPFDAAGDRISLSWRGGIDAFFFRELAAAFYAAGNSDSTGDTYSAGDSAAGNSDSTEESITGNSAVFRAAERRPEGFDWPRFRELLAGGDVPGEIRRDPWLADWTLIAAATVRSGFDRRRILPQDPDPLRVTIPGPGPWIGPSPFMEPAFWEAGEIVELGTGDRVDTYISAEAVLRCNRRGWTWFPRQGFRR
jgi:hypothetical protein